MANSQTTAQLKIKINGKEVENSFSAIRKEVISLERDLKKLTPGTAEFQHKAAELKEVRAHFERVRNEINATTRELQKSEGIVDKVIKSFGGLGSVFTIGASVSLAATTQELLKISDAITDVQKTSGLAQKEVEALWKEFSNFDTRTSKLELMNIAQIGGRLGITDKEQLQEFTREIDKIYVALGDSFQGGLEEVTTKVGKLKNLFDETKNTDYATALNEIGSALNELGANGTASESNITEFATRVGAMPSALKPAIDKTLGLGAAFEESGISAERAQSGYGRFMSVAGNNIEGFAQQMKIGVKEAQELFRTKPEEFFIKFGESLQPFQKEGDTVAKILHNLKIGTDETKAALGAAGSNANRFREMMDLATRSMGEATSIQEEFDKKNNNSAAIWEKIANGIKNFITDGAIPDFFNWITGIVGKITGVVQEGNNGIIAFREKLSFLAKLLLVVTSAVLSYKTAMYLAMVATKGTTQQTVLLNAAQKVWNALLVSGKSLILTARVVMLALTGQITAAKNAMHAFNLATKANPWGALAAVVATVVVALIAFNRELSESARLQKQLDERMQKVNERVSEERMELDKLLKIANNKNLSDEIRERAVKKINELYPEYLGNLTLEKIKTGEAKDMIDKYIASLTRKAELEALSEEKKELFKEKRKLENQRPEKDSGSKIADWIFGDTEEFEKTAEEEIKKFETSLKKSGISDEKISDMVNAYANGIRPLYEEKEAELKRIENALKNVEEAENKLLTQNPETLVGDTPKEGDTKTENGITYVFKNGKWVPVKNEKTKSTTPKKDYTSDFRNAQKARMQVEQELQKEITQSLEESLDKQLAITEQKYNDKKFKLQQENIDLELENKNLQKEAKTNKDPHIDKIIDEKRKIIELNKQIEIEIEKQKQTELAQVQDKWLISQFEKKAQAQQKEINLRENALREEILLLDDLETAKQKIRDSQFNTLSEKEISQLKTLEDAKKALRVQADKEILTLSLQSFEAQKEILKEYLASVSGEAKDKLLGDLQKIEEQIIKIKEQQDKGGKEKEGENKEKYKNLEKVDILGFSAKDWLETYENLDKLETRFKAIDMSVSALNNAFSMFAQLQQNLNEKEMRSFSANQDKKKRALLDQLNQGYISQAQYQKETQRLEEEAETKRKELSLKQFKAQKAMNMMNIVANTATGIMRAYSDTGPIVGTAFAAIIAALGAVQLGIVASQQPPSYATGGRTQGLGFRDSSGHEVAGVVHANEYVIPEWLRKDPEVARVEQWLESKRIGNRQQIMGNSFAEGGRVAPANDYEAVNEQLQNIRSANNETALLSALERLIDLLEKLERDGIDAFVVADAKNGKEIQKAIKLYQDLKDKNKH